MNEPMNEETRRLKQMLEAATAADRRNTERRRGRSLQRCGNRLAPRGLVGLGQLICAADAAMPEVHIAEPDGATPIARRKPRGSRLPGLLAATAAALLVAVTFGWWIGRDGRQENSNGSNPEPSLAQTPAPEHAKPQAMRRGLPQTTVAGTENAADKKANADKKVNNVAATTSTWDDPLETQIASVSQEISDVEQNWQHRVDDVDLVQYRIDEVSASLQNDTL